MNQLAELHVEGFRSIKEAKIELGPLNVFIGANGTGKSNLIDFFRMLNYALSRGFQSPYLTDRGPASHILHFGPRRTPVINAELKFTADRGHNFYRFSLAHVRQDDTFLFTNEEVQFHASDRPAPAAPIPVGPGGHRESGLSEQWSADEPTVRFIKRLIGRCRVYQFHDTGVSSYLRGKPFVEDNRYLRADGGNLAAVLLRLSREQPDIFQEVTRSIQAVLPWLDEFVLEPEGPEAKQVVPLRWRMTGQGDYDFVAGQLSDGSLRIIALVTLLLLPEEMLPGILIIDEPELGLHPAAENVIEGLIKHASRTCQVILSTQSSTFIDHFGADDIIVTEIEDGKSSFTRQSEERLKNWLARYTLSQIWNKNIIGGRP
ncbi:MAG: AAA family ATPase [Verrucomicrobia bacterium]|nr:AAA family ATPase [Verrucomicrobiota bacterium]